MFVPIEKMYNFLDQFVDDDVLIYRFYPNGSRKLFDISLLRSVDFDQIAVAGSIPMLMHDQEPLNFDYYKNLDLEDIWSYMRKNHASRITRLEKYGQIDRMIEIHKSNNLDIFNGNYLADCWLLCHSEKKSLNLVKYESLGAIGVYWWSHALIARDWYRYAQVDQRLIYSAMDFDKDFNVYNRAWTGTREYRLKFAEMCVKNDLLPFTSITVSKHDSGYSYCDHVFKNPRFDLKSDISMLCSTQPSSDSSADYNHEDYQKTAIDVVLETLFDDERLHLTEKILRPIACGKPFIIVSTPGSLQYLRDYGFETFGEYLDESYDDIQDPVDRLESIIKLMKTISQLPKNKKIQLHWKLHQVADRNKKLFWSDKFVQQVVDEFKHNFQKSYIICKQSQNGNKMFALWKEFSDNNEISYQDIMELLRKIKQK